jgi:Zn/Cd-binding protein ZinT
MEQNKNMTAVDWFADEIWSLAIQLIYDEMNEGQFAMAHGKLVEQAKEMDKDQTKAAYNQGYKDAEIDNFICDHKGDVINFVDAEQYYNNTYNIPSTERTYEVWSEGYAATGESAGARFHGKFKGATFKDAVESYINTLSPDSRKSFNGERLTYWGCRFFDNEQDARKSFG